MEPVNFEVMVHTSLAVLLEDLAKRDTRMDTDAARMAAAHRQEIAFLTAPWPSSSVADELTASLPTSEEVPGGEATE